MPPQTGSFGASLGGAGALKAAMERRGMDASILDQVSPAAPGPESPVAPPIQGTAQQVASQVTGGAPARPAGGTQVPVRSGEMEIALGAMKDVIKSETKIAEAILGLR